MGFSLGLGNVHVPISGDFTDDGCLLFTAEIPDASKVPSLGRVDDPEGTIGNLGLENIPAPWKNRAELLSVKAPA